ncbi:MAG TPA: NAD(P)H:quinone oxidoreductase [Tepidisphaeraceae bacterium]|jgi:NAD(P)H dehydrogenase (quinone)
MPKILIAYYSLYGHIHTLARAVAEGATAAGADVTVKQVRETLPDDVIAKMGATDAKKAFADVPFADPKELPQYDAIVIGVPTRYGAVGTQMQTFLDATGGSWAAGELIGKLGSGFTSTGSQHGGQETTLQSLYTFFYAHGMAVCGVPYSTKELMTMGEITGGGPLGAGTIAGADGSRRPSENELAIARAQGRHVATLAAKLAK